MNRRQSFSSAFADTRFDSDAETQDNDPLFFPVSPALSLNRRSRQPGLSREQQCRPTVTPPTVTRPSASNTLQRENTERPAAPAVDNIQTSIHATAIGRLQFDVSAMKRTLSAMSNVQDEILSCVKKLKKGFEADQLEIGKCCHTENLIQLLAKLYTSVGRFPLESPEKEKTLKQEFTNSPTGLTLAELLIRFKKFENAKLSYWRSEERRRLLGIAGYETLCNAPTEIVTDKIMQPIGQKHSHGCNRINLHKEIIVVRNFIRKVSLERARRLKDFWASFYSWKTTQWPNGITPDHWHMLRSEDTAAYGEE